MAWLTPGNIEQYAKTSWRKLSHSRTSQLLFTPALVNLPQEKTTQILNKPMRRTHKAKDRK
jgi:hypothetical protein